MNGKALVVAVQTGIPIIVWGKPGTGKTSFIIEFARAVGRHMETVIASIREPSDFAGLPIITKDDTVNLAAPSWVKNIIEKEKDGIHSIVFLDELSTAPPAVQAALLRPVFEGAVGDEQLPKSVWFVGAANPTDTSSGTWTLSAALANRFVHLDWDIETLAWVEGMQNGFKMDHNITILPKGWKESIPQFRTLISSFIKARPALLLNQPDNTEDAGGAWASPRSWDNAATMLAACRSISLDKNTTLSLIAGCVGSGPTVEFFNWEKNLDLPDPEVLLKNPKSFKVPAKGDVTFAILSSVVTAARGKMNKARWESAWEILGIAAEGGKADIAAIPAKNLAKAREKGMAVPIHVKKFMPVLKKAGLLG